MGQISAEEDEFLQELKEQITSDLVFGEYSQYARMQKERAQLQKINGLL